jgi:hypothetical protein
MLCRNRELLLFYPALHHGAVPQAKEGDGPELNREQYREPEDTVATATRDEATRLLPFFYHNRAATFICLAFKPFDRMPERLVEPIGELPAPSILLSLVVSAFVPK